MKTLFLILVAFSCHAADLGFCYDRQRWPETAALSRLGGASVFNINNGRGASAGEKKDWDAFKNRCRTVGGKILGYVDFNNESGKRKADTAIFAEVAEWMRAGYDGIWGDDTRDRVIDATLLLYIARSFPGKLVIGNPGARCKGALKSSGILLCEHEDLSPINWDSRVIIALVGSAKEAAAVRAKARVKKTAFIAVEPRSAYHVDGVEYQEEDPFALK